MAFISHEKKNTAQSVVIGHHCYHIFILSLRWGGVEEKHKRSGGLCVLEVGRYGMVATMCNEFRIFRNSKFGVVNKQAFS